MEEFDLELGQATIRYDDPDEGIVTETVGNEQLVYARDHWMVRAGTDAQGNDLMRQIPRDRVHAVERNVQQFEEEAATVRHRVESLASDIRNRIPVDIGGPEWAHGEEPPSDSTTVHVETTADEREHDEEQGHEEQEPER